MTVDPHVKRFLDRLGAANPKNALALTVGERRNALGHLLGFAGPPEPVSRVEDRELPGPAGPLPVRIYTPIHWADAERGPRAGLLYLHGGGLVAGNLDTHDGIARSLANASGCRLIALGYRLAPEHRFPAALDDACAAARWCSAHTSALGIDADRFGICGDSAGATLAAAVCQWAAQAREVRFVVQFLLCPILDFRAETPSRRAYGAGFLLDAATLEHDLQHYLGPDADPVDPRISPLRASDVRDLPPTVIHTAELDPLRDEGQAYAERLERAGVETLYRCHSGMIHLFYGMGALIPYVVAGYQAMGADIRSLVSAHARGESIR